MKIISNTAYSFNQGIKGILKNKTMSFISIASVTSVLVILGIVLSMVVNINSFVENAKDEVNEIRVSFSSQSTKKDNDYIKEELEKINGINNVRYESKEDSFDNIKKSFGEDNALLDGIKNPLDDSYIVTIDDSEEITKLATQIEDIKGVLEVKYHKDIMENFLTTSQNIKQFGGVIIVFLLVICLVLISNTIKARVHSKKEEIEVIKYIGGSNSFVIVPFIVEGCMIGLLGSFISIAICTSMYKYILDNMQGSIDFIIGNVMLPISSIFYLLAIVLFTTGIVVGAIGSGFSVKKYLKV